MQLVLIQSSDSFNFVVVFWFDFFFLSLEFFFYSWSLFWWGVGEWGGNRIETWGYEDFRLCIQQANMMYPKVNLSQEWNNFSINKHKNLVFWLTGSKRVKMEFDEFQHNGAPGPLGLFILLWFYLFSLETCSFSWDLKWTHLCAVLVFAILISSIIDICNGENIWTVAFFILVTCDAIKWR